jgi:6-phosphogluconolactonase
VAEGPRIVHTREPIREAATRLAEIARERLRGGHTVRMAIPGGSALAALAAARGELGDDWGRVRLTWVDERCVAQDDPESNRGASYRTGALEGGHPPLFELPLYLDEETPGQAVQRVDAALQDHFDDALDVLLLGLGEDGHVASLFPGAWPALADARVAHVPDSPKPPPARITLGRRMLASAPHAVLLATGEAKRGALLRLRAGDAALPATGLPGLVVMTDLDLEANEGELG